MIVLFLDEVLILGRCMCEERLASLSNETNIEDLGMPKSSKEWCWKWVAVGTWCV